MHNKIGYAAPQHQSLNLNRRLHMTIQIDKFVNPVRELNALNVANLEKLVAIQLEGIEEVAKTGVESLKKAAAVNDLEGAKSYLSGQVEVIQGVVENAIARSRSVAEIAQSYSTSAKKIVENAVTIS